MGAAWREPKDRDMPAIVEMVKGVKAMGLETCMTLGMLTAKQAAQLAEAGLDYYNHNIDTSPENYGNVIGTRTLGERLDTLEQVRKAGINVCCGGIVGMGESRDDRVGFIHALATLPRHPESVPVNALVPVRGHAAGRHAARHAARRNRRYRVRAHRRRRAHHHADAVWCGCPRGAKAWAEATQALCFMAGANSIFTGDKLLTTGNRGDSADAALFGKLGLRPMEGEEPMRACGAMEAAK